MRLLITAFLLVALAPPTTAQTKRALIIGIDTYQPEDTTAQLPGCAYAAIAKNGRCAIGNFHNLDGAVNDAQSMAEVLTSHKFNFLPKNVVLLTNPARKPMRAGIQVLSSAQTTRDGILAAMQKYLVEIPQKGDTVLLYDASHGSLRVNTAGDKLTIRDREGTLVHVDSTLVPSDAYTGAYDIRDREMTRIFNAALDKGIRLTVIFDSCHSGGLTRGIGGAKRSLPYDPRPVTDGETLQKPTERQGNPALVFTAAQQDQSAGETMPTESSPEIHGAFTAALIETLQILPADAPASLVYQRVKSLLEGQGTLGQEPDLDAGSLRRQQPLFGGTANAANAGKVYTEALKANDDGSVWLDIGMVSGIGAGSEFARDLGSGKVIRLKVKQPLGIARSKATVVGPAKAKIAIGDVFTLTRLVPAQSDPLYFWLGATNLSMGDIRAAVTAIEASGIPTISDPAEEPYADSLSWNGNDWILQHAAAALDHTPTTLLVDSTSEAPVKLGPTLSTVTLKQAASPGTKLWVNLPAPRELAVKLNLSDPYMNAMSTQNLAKAHYVLAGSLAGGSPTYTWFHKNEFAAGPRTTLTSDHTPGCSTTSPYPVRSDWIATQDVDATAKTAATMNTYALRLARVHSWLQLANNPVVGASLANFYRLAMVHPSDTGDIPSDQPVHENDRARLALQSDTPIAARDSRWVYVLDIDCQGTGTLLYPQGHSGNQYPSRGDTGPKVILRSALPIRFQEPFGVESMILLSTAQPLPDPSVLDFTGVARAASRGVQTPFERLLSNTSSGTRQRGADAPIPTDWGIQIMTVRSIPANASK